jgi:hypothetical protein
VHPRGCWRGQLGDVQEVRDTVIADLQQAFHGYPAKDRFLQAGPDVDLPGEMVENPGALTFLHIGPAARFQDHTVHPCPVQQRRQRQTGRARPHDRHRGLFHRPLRHGTPPLEIHHHGSAKAAMSGSARASQSDDTTHRPADGQYTPCALNPARLCRQHGGRGSGI